jgi:hypothetical protein
MCKYIKEYYKVPADIGRRIKVNGVAGTIVEDRGNYLGVNFDNDKPGVIRNVHPTWKVEYMGMGIIRRSKKQDADYVVGVSTEE